MSETKTLIENEVYIELPPRYNVVLHNDEITPMGFVVELLCTVFHYQRATAMEAMLEIHNNGKKVVGTYIKSIAETKMIMVREVSAAANYPLVATLEKCD